MLRRGLIILATVALTALIAPPAHAALSLQSDGSFDTPIFATSPRGATTDLYVVQRAGAIRIVRNGATLAQPFLTIPDVNDQGEGGLLSMAFSTDYSSSGLFYVYLTPDDPAANSPIQIREYRRSASDPDRADPASARAVLTIPHAENGNHYGGTLQFGPDGRLYIGTGDGGGGGDPNNNAQTRGSMLGKILRLDPRQTGSASYAVPADNPYAASPGSELVWSSGLRNPYRYSFDRSTGALNIGDVGQGRYEEIDLAQAPSAGRGLNFGWRACEGDATYPSGAPGSCATPGLTGPVFTYDHSSGRCSITGGVVSRDPGVEELAGRYLYADYCGNDIRSQALGNPGGDAATGLTGSQTAAFGEDACGRVHVVGLGGAVAKVSDGSPGPCAVQAEFTAPGATPTARPPTPPVALRLSTKVAKRQKVLKRRYLTLRVRCSATCSLRIKSRVAVRGRKSRRLKDVKRARLTGSKMLHVPISRSGRVAIRRALRTRRRVSLRLTVRVRSVATKQLVAKRLTVRIVG